MPAKNMLWDTDADRRLLLAAIEVAGITPNCAAIAAKMSNEDRILTPNAIAMRWRKLVATQKSDGEPFPPKAGKRGGSDCDAPKATKKQKVNRKDVGDVVIPSPTRVKAEESAGAESEDD